MARGLHLNLYFPSTVGLCESFAFLFDNVLADYFRPHTASLLMYDGGGATGVAGGFLQWRTLGMSREQLTLPFFPRLPSETADLHNLWTTTDLPDCGTTIVNWLLQLDHSSSWEMNVFGELDVLLDGPGSISKKLFRQIFDNSKHRQIQNIAPIERTALLRIQCMVLRAHLAPDDEEVASTSPVDDDYIDDDYIAIHIDSMSDFWLENGEAFKGRAAGMAERNTEALAIRLRDYVVWLGDALEEVTMYALEGREWIREQERIWSTFQIIPNISLE